MPGLKLSVGSVQSMNHSQPVGQPFCMCGCLSITTQSARGALDGFQCSYSISSASHLVRVLTLQQRRGERGAEEGVLDKLVMLNTKLLKCVWMDFMIVDKIIYKYIFKITMAEKSETSLCTNVQFNSH